jgi:hypothetical protein
MPSLPTPSRLPLASAIERIAKLTNASLLHSDLFDAVHAALCEGVLIAIGDQETCDGESIRQYCKVPEDAWQEMSARDFRRNYEEPANIPPDRLAIFAHPRLALRFGPRCLNVWN